MKYHKKRLLLTVALMASFGVNAQQKESKFFAEVSAGPSFPIGQFGEKEYAGTNERDQPGMAKTGIAANVTLGYYIKENAGVLLTGGYGAYKQNTEGFSTYLKRNYYVSATEVDVNTKNWKIIKVMGGGFLVTPLTENKLNLITKVSAGVLKATVPAYDWRAYAATGPAFAGGGVEKYKLPATFCYQISLGLQYKLNDKFHLLFDINSFNATATHEAPQQSTGNPPGTPTIPNKKYKFGSVNALAGVGVSF